MEVRLDERGVVSAGVVQRPMEGDDRSRHAVLMTRDVKRMKRMGRLTVWVLSIASALGACSNSESASCRYTSAVGTAICAEYDGPDARAAAASLCSSYGGAYSESGICDRAGTVGGCVIADGPAMLTAWFFAPSTAEGVEANCTSNGGTFLTP